MVQAGRNPTGRQQSDEISNGNIKKQGAGGRMSNVKVCFDFRHQGRIDDPGRKVKKENGG